MHLLYEGCKKTQHHLVARISSRKKFCSFQWLVAVISSDILQEARFPLGQGLVAFSSLAWTSDFGISWRSLLWNLHSKDQSFLWSRHKVHVAFGSQDQGSSREAVEKLGHHRHGETKQGKGRFRVSMNWEMLLWGEGDWSFIIPNGLFCSVLKFMWQKLKTNSLLFLHLFLLSEPRALLDCPLHSWMALHASCAHYPIFF